MAEIFVQSIEGLRMDAVWDLLSESRKRKIARLKNEQQQLLSAAAELALNRAISSQFPNVSVPIQYAYMPNGKPYLSESEGYISLSHSGKWAVCAYSDREVGVDLQEIRPVNWALVERFFTKEEVRAIRDSENPDRAFCEVWVKKEARVKLTGEGIGGGFEKIKADLPGQYRYILHDIGEENYVLCTCERMTESTAGRR